MKKIYFIIFLMGLFCTLNSFGGDTRPLLGEDCRRYIGTCEYYLCRENNKPCNIDGYFIGFGYKYCTKSLNRLMPKVSRQGKEWIVRTSICLQEQLEEVDDSKTCSQIKREAVLGHGTCYEESGFCSLGPADRFEVLKMVTPSFKVRGVLSQSIRVLRYCSRFKNI